MAVFIKNLTKNKIPINFLRNNFEKVFSILEVNPDKNVNIIFIADEQMKKINNKYRGINKITDVLSFNIEDSKKENFLFNDKTIGEIFISWQKAIEQAKKIGHSSNQEVTRLFVHGFLHILGFDHEKINDQKKMEQKEKWIIFKTDL